MPPMTLDTPETVAKAMDTLEINSFAIDLERLEVIVSYDMGYIDQGSFTPVLKDRLLTVPTAEFAAAIAAVDAEANAMPAGSVSVYGAIKSVLYSKITEATGITGTVS